MSDTTTTTAFERLDAEMVRLFGGRLGNGYVSDGAPHATLVEAPSEEYPDAEPGDVVIRDTVGSGVVAASDVAGFADALSEIEADGDGHGDAFWDAYSDYEIDGTGTW